MYAQADYRVERIARLGGGAPEKTFCRQRQSPTKGSAWGDEKKKEEEEEEEEEELLLLLLFIM